MLQVNINHKKIFAIIKQINQAGGDVTKESLVSDFTNSRTTSLGDLNFEEYQLFEKNLVAMAPNRQVPVNYSSDPLDAARKAIISQFLSIGRTAAEAKAWAEKYGVKGKKRRFNEYTGQELFILVQNAKKVKADFIRAVNKKI